jgi:solute carrier family 25 (mitochondrial thiamine pyrophosphate transporter), member 19
MEPFISGVITGFTTRLLTAPLDLVKIRLQLQDNQFVKYKNTIDTFTKVIREEGVFGLWKGNLAGLALYASYGGIQFYILENVRTGIKGFDGAIAATGAYIFTYPFDLLRTHFTVISKKDGSFLKPKDLYRGLSASLLQIIPYMGLLFQIESILSPYMPHSLSGFLAGGLAKTAIFPLDVIRRRMQIQNNPINLDRSYILRTPIYEQSVLGTAKSLLRNEGWRALYSGLSIALLKSAPATAITFYVYNKLISR